MDVARYIRTIRYLKMKQIIYQCRYKINGYYFPDRPKRMPVPVREFDISSSFLDLDEQYIERYQPDKILENRIVLLNEEVIWKQGRWDYKGKSHLWNFNLHYFEYGVALVAKYKKTGNDRYLKKFNEMYRDWHDNNLFRHGGDGWHPYTISLRLKNLLIIYSILEGGIGGMMVSDIYEQYRFLIKNQEKHLLGNHYFENLVTILLCSVFFGEEEVKELYSRKLIKQIKEQILDDGMHFERSFMYHNLILEDLLRMWFVGDKDFRNCLKDKIKKMADCVHSFEEENRIPLFNDAGSNIAKRKSQLLETVRYLLDYVPKSVDLPQAGYFRIQNDMFYVVMDVGQFAPAYISGHGHCDALSLELFYKGDPILVNSGTYQYQSELREYFRGTASHNTVKVLDMEQAECWGEHRTARRYRVVKRMKTENRIVGVIKDYKGNQICRSVTIGQKIVVEDSCSKRYESYWHIHPSNKVEQIDSRKLEITTGKGNKVYLAADADLTNAESWNAEEFGKIEKNPAFFSHAKRIEIYAG